MPSSNKTSHLRLNYWQGADKPKREDFNSDNTLLDAACSALSTAQAAASSSLSSLNTRCDTINTSLTSHTGNAAAHITAAERTAWNGLLGSNMAMGAYNGTGTATLKVTMGFQPRFGYLFAVGSGVVECNFGLEQNYVFSAFFSTQGCSRNVVLESDGITVTHTTSNASNGIYYYYNQSGKTYVYVAWK